MPWIRLQARTYRERKLYGAAPAVKWCWLAVLCVVAEEGKNGKVTCDVRWLAKEIDFEVEILITSLQELSERQMISLVESDPPYVARTDGVRQTDATRSLRTDETDVTERNGTDVIPSPAAPPTMIKNRAAYKFSEQDMRCATWFQRQVKTGNPLARRIDKANLDQWANEIRLMQDVDGLTHEDLAAVLTFALTDRFWKTVIQSPASLRAKWDKLSSQMAAPRSNANAGGFRGTEA
jgi:hypothetical protein